jgi:hypothetical protein
MAKKTTTGNSQKISFGKRRVGKHKKTNGPKDKATKRYVGQGK